MRKVSAFQLQRVTPASPFQPSLNRAAIGRRKDIPPVFREKEAYG